MDRRTIVLAVAAGLVGARPAVDAQQTEQRRRIIAWLDLSKKETNAVDMGEFRRRLGALGWIEGVNIDIVARWADDKPDRLPALTTELIALKPDVIVTLSTPASWAAKKATAQIPIVVAGINDPVDSGLITSLARPGGNVTGQTNNPGIEIYQRMVQLLKEAAPRISPRFLMVVAIAASSCLALASPASSEPNYQGLWWNSPPNSESGWGINLAHQGDVIFATWFTYDADGGGWWLTMTANKTAEGTYAGTWIETTGPAFSAVPFEAGKVTRSEVGHGTLSFQDADTGTLRYTLKGASRTKFITRMVFGLLPTCTYGARPDFAAVTNYTDMWWAANGAESGWGINLEHQGDTIFATWFTYDTDGTPLSLSVTGAKTAPNVYRGQLIRTTGPAFNAVPFDPATVTRTVVGTATFAFTNGNAATFAYMLNGVSRTTTIGRQLFVPPAGTVCGEPYRAPAPVTIVAAGDIADCGKKPAAASGAAMTAALVGPPDALVLTLGDNVYENGTSAEFAGCFQPTWGAFKDRIRPSPGNHDYNTAGAAGYFAYFGELAGPDRRGYYSFDYGGWHFISLNSQIDVSPESEQYGWLTADLAKSRDSLCTIAYWHYPAFSSGTKHGSIKAMRPFFDLLYTAGVEIVLSGHEHLYERFGPQSADGTADPARGVREFVVGTGGAELYPIGHPTPNSEYRDNTTWGILRLTLDQGSYSWQFVPVGGGYPADYGTGTCHP